MIRLAIVAEGATEGEFVRGLLAPHLLGRGVIATAPLLGIHGGSVTRSGGRSTGIMPGTGGATSHGCCGSCTIRSMNQIAKAYRALRRLVRLCGPDRRVRVAIARDLWEDMCAELGRRGGGQREAGAFLLADPQDGRRRVRRIAYYDDLDPGCLTGNIHFRGAGYGKLWDLCDETGLRVVADVHTHPAGGAAQSVTDRANPMIARPGHVALILPHYATRRIAARDVGVHEYMGESGWASRFGAGAARALRIG